MNQRILSQDAFRKRFNRDFEEFTRYHRQKMPLRDRAVSQLIAQACSMLLTSGKRIRPYLAYASSSSSGAPLDEAIKLGIALELFHGYAIVHDDIIDQSDMRRGVATIHAYFATHHEQKHWLGSAQRFGEAFAILAGDLLMAWSDLALRYVSTGKAQKNIERTWDDMKEEVILGQALDVSIGANAKRPSRANLMHMVAVKSGRYTIGRPMLLGYALANAAVREETVMRIAEPLGIAFQIQDDALSSFGDAHTIGKPVDADMREGKMTLLAFETMRRLSPAQERIWEKGFGKPEASTRAINDAKNLMVTSGARTYVETLAEQLIELSMERAADLPDGGSWFLDFASRMRHRTA